MGRVFGGLASETVVGACASVAAGGGACGDALVFRGRRIWSRGAGAGAMVEPKLLGQLAVWLHGSSRH